MTASAPHDPYNVIAGGFVQLQGGTSAATPVFAGIVALLNQYLQTNGAPDQAPGVGNINPTLYQLAQSVPAIFHDIVNGSNIVPCDPASPDCANGQLGYSAGPGYDLVTGLGSVDAYNLVTQWNGIPGGAPAIAGLAPASTTAGGVSFKLTVNGSNFAAGAQVQWNGTALPTAVVNSTQLTATVDTKLIAAPGVVAITVAQGGAGSGVFYFTVHASASMALVYGNQRVTKTAPNVCNVPQAMNSFLTTDAAIYLWFQATITANDRFVVSWLAPDGSVGNFVFGGLQPATNYCALTLSYPISNLPASLLGPWQVRLYDNATQLFSIPFTVSAP
jgi:subtilase family serine protease